MILIFALSSCGAAKTPTLETAEPPAIEQTQTPAQEPVPKPEPPVEQEIEPPAELVPVMEKPEGAMFLITFEDEAVNGFAGRGSEKVFVSDEAAHTGKYSLKATERTAAWNGPSLSVTEYIGPASKHNFSVWVKAGASATYTLSVQEGEGDSASYTNIFSLGFGPNNDWIELTGSFRFSGSGYASVYVECSNPNAEFYIDDVQFSLEESKGYVYDDSLPSLKEIYKDYFLIGCAVSTPDLSGKRFEVFRQHFNVQTAANAMKPASLSPAKGEYRFSAADSMAKTIKEAGMPLYGHTLVWHKQSAAWLNPEGTTYEEAKSNLEEYITSVAEHFGQEEVKVFAWDVVNEALEDGTGGASWKDALRKSLWYKAYANGSDGWAYIEDAFRFARAADPDAILYYNDFNLDFPDKAAAVAAMVKEINDKYLAEGNTRKLIEGIGMQAHYSLNTDPVQVESSINRFIALGVEISITELDITASEGLGFTEALENRQAVLYARLMNIYKKYSDNIVRVTFWGLDDGTSWRAKQNPCLFNEDLSAKKAFFAVADPDGFLEQQ